MTPKTELEKLSKQCSSRMLSLSYLFDDRGITFPILLQNAGQAVAIKVVTKKGLQKASEILVKEIKILRELTALHHTNLVAMHDCMDSPGYVYVVMEVSRLYF